MKIQTEILAIMLSVILITGVISAVASQVAARNIVEQDVCNYLETTAQSRKTHIEAFMAGEKERIELMASSFVIKNFLATGKEDSDYPAEYKVAAARLSSMLGTARTFNKLSVLDENGIVVASTDEDFVGSDKSADSSFLEGRKGTYIKSAHACKLTGEPAMSMATPMVDNNELLGIMVAGMSLTELDQITTDRTGLGETGEIYLLNKDGYMITPSRFIDDTSLKQQVDTPESRECWELPG